MATNTVDIAIKGHAIPRRSDFLSAELEARAIGVELAMLCYLSCNANIEKKADITHKADSVLSIPGALNGEFPRPDM